MNMAFPSFQLDAPTPMSTRSQKGKEIFRPTQQLVIWSKLRQQSKTPAIKLVDFVVPYNYTHSLTTRSFELLRALLALFSMEEHGVVVSEMKLDIGRLSLVSKDGEVIVDRESPVNIFQPISQTMAEVLPQLYRDLFTGLDGLHADGTGEYLNLISVRSPHVCTVGP